MVGGEFRELIGLGGGLCRVFVEFGSEEFGFCFE